MRDLAPCCICGTLEREILFQGTAQTKQGWQSSGPYGGHYQINVCNGCGLRYSSPIFDADDVRTLYTDYKEANVAEEELANVRATMVGYYNLARPFVQRKNRALDIGCDIGLLLEVMCDDGFKELYGLEPVAVARMQAVKRVSGAVISGTFYEDASFEENSFDLIALVHVVDHLVRPDSILDRIHRHLRPGGVCVAIVHNVESLLARLTGERFPVFNYFHHYFFSKRTLRALFESRGFEILRVTSTQNRYSLSFFIERTPLLPDGWRSKLSLLARRAGFGGISLSISLGNIGIVARKPSSMAS